MAQWTELNDFRDDCRSVQASGAAVSKACVEALGKELEPPPYVPTHFSRLGKRDFYSTIAVRELYPGATEIWRYVKFCVEAMPIGLQTSITSASHLANRQMRELPHYAQILSGAIMSRLQGFSVFFQNGSIQKLPSLLLHPWTSDGALLLVSTAQYFRSNIVRLQFAFIITILLIQHLINGRYGATTATVCRGSILLGHPIQHSMYTSSFPLSHEPNTKEFGPQIGNGSLLLGS